MKRGGEQEIKVDIVRARKVVRMGDRQGGRYRVKRGMSDDGWDGLKDSWREGLMEGGRVCGPQLMTEC